MKITSGFTAAVLSENFLFLNWRKSNYFTLVFPTKLQQALNIYLKKAQT